MSTLAVIDPKVLVPTELALARIHPAHFLRHVFCVDNTSGDTFRFHFSPEQLIKFASTPNSMVKQSLPIEVAEKMVNTLMPEYEETGWEWQGEIIDWWVNEFVTMILKARQLGITWCAAGVGLWIVTMLPGTRVLAQSMTEDDAADIIDHAWEMFISLKNRKPHLVQHIDVHKPFGDRRPHLDIEFIHPDGRKSRFNAMPSSPSRGHGRTATFVILDEFARHPYARESYKATVPAQAGSKKASGRTAIISTGNGVSVDEDAGNYFHHLWANAKRYGISTQFLRWDTNPDRDQEWYERVARKLPSKDRGEQYPQNPNEAFILTGDLYFDEDSVFWYGEEGTKKPLYSCEFKIVNDGSGAKLRKTKYGSIDVFVEPKPGHKYAIGADVATGTGRDFSAAYVVDLETQALVAEYNGKIDPDVMARDLHFLGRWYNTAWIAVEKGGGYGEAVIVPLRDGKQGRPPYPKLYRHIMDSRTTQDLSKSYGMPMSASVRQLVLGNMKRILRDKSLPWVTEGLMDEIRTFVYRKRNPSPAANDGCNDDRVMACAITLEMFRRYGAYQSRPVKKHDYDEDEFVPPYPWSKT